MELGPDDIKTRMLDLFRYAQVGFCVNGVTHDINNFLGAMMAYSELIGMESSLSPDTKGMVEQVVNATAKCGELTGAFTNIARRQLASEAAVDFNRLLQTASALRNYDCKMNSVKLELELDSGSVTLVTDLPKLQLAFVYLLINAQEAAQEAAEKRVRLRTVANPEGVAVEFWNPGMPATAEEATPWFTPYYTTKESPHMGLGLTAAHEIVQSLGGSLTYEPERGLVLFIPRKNSSATL